jgi:hypothetical protein
MATTVENPFDTQQANPTNQNIQAGSTQPMTDGSVGSTSFQQHNPVPNLQPQTYTASTSQVNAPTETMQGQVASILSQDSPLMQRARTLATQEMAQRGLVNSSMAQGAGVAAMTDRALPIASQDAQTYSQRAMMNQDALNQASQFNVGQQNQMFQFGQDIASRFGLQAGQQQFQAEQANLDRSLQAALQANQITSQEFQQLRDISSREGLAAADRALQQLLQSNQFGFQTQERLGAQEFDLTRLSAQQRNQLEQMAVQQQNAMQQLSSQQSFQERMSVLEQSGLDFRQAREIASREMLTQLELLGVNNRFDQELALKAEMFNVEQFNMERRQIIDNNAQLERLGFTINAQERQLPTQFAATISNSTMAGVSAILSDPQLSADAKRAQVQNLVNYANAQLSWAERFYATSIPQLATPI